MVVSVLCAGPASMQPQQHGMAWHGTWHWHGAAVCCCCVLAQLLRRLHAHEIAGCDTRLQGLTIGVGEVVVLSSCHGAWLWFARGSCWWFAASFFLVTTPTCVCVCVCVGVRGRHKGRLILCVWARCVMGSYAIGGTCVDLLPWRVCVWWWLVPRTHTGWV